jgi:hypothetical protein
MPLSLSLRLGLMLSLSLAAVAARDIAPERELIQDPGFRHGFVLWEPKPGKHVRYGELRGLEAKAKPVWGLSQWSSRFPLENGSILDLPDGALVCSNAAKAITMGPAGNIHADFSMAVNSRVEYGEHARKPGTPWVHLLVEQEFDPPAPLHELSAAKLHVEARLLHARDLHRDDYSPDVHAAQFQIYFTVQNRNRASRGFGDLVWFGIPIYDNRDRFPKEFKAQDFGGTEKFIFTPDGKTFTTNSPHEGQWVIIEKDLLPLMREALEAAWTNGFLKQSKTFSDYHIGGMNMGWEVPGTFDVEMQVRKLSLKLSPKPPLSK